MSTQNNTPHLSLYHFASCPFCLLTRRAIDDLGLDIELRDIQRNADYRRELAAGGGKSQVPSLRIDGEDGSVRWLYESRDIIKFLHKHYAHAA